MDKELLVLEKHYDKIDDKNKQFLNSFFINLDLNNHNINCLNTTQLTTWLIENKQHIEVDSQFNFTKYCIQHFKRTQSTNNIPYLKSIVSDIKILNDILLHDIGNSKFKPLFLATDNYKLYDFKNDFKNVNNDGYLKYQNETFTNNAKTSLFLEYSNFSSSLNFKNNINLTEYRKELISHYNNNFLDNLNIILGKENYNILKNEFDIEFYNFINKEFEKIIHKKITNIIKHPEVKINYSSEKTEDFQFLIDYLESELETNTNFNIQKLLSYFEIDNEDIFSNAKDNALIDIKFIPNPLINSYKFIQIYDLISFVFKEVSKNNNIEKGFKTQINNNLDIYHFIGSLNDVQINPEQLKLNDILELYIKRQETLTKENNNIFIYSIERLFTKILKDTPKEEQNLFIFNFFKQVSKENIEIIYNNGIISKLLTKFTNQEISILETNILNKILITDKNVAKTKIKI